jgi:hypothetical protein
VVAGVLLNSSQLQTLAGWNVHDVQLVNFGQTLLQLDVALHAAVEAMVSPLPVGLRAAAAGGACSSAAACKDAFDRLLSDGAVLTGVQTLTPEAAVEAAAADGRAGSDASRQRHREWNARAAVWLAQRQRHARVARCGWVGL